MNKPTPLFVLAITTVILTALSVWIIATIYTSAFDRQAEEFLNPVLCVSETGHKKVPCPEEYHR